MAETSSLLNCRTGNGTESSNLSLTAIILKDNRSGRSSARLECLLWEQEAAGSNPAAPTETINLVDGFFFALMLAGQSGIINLKLPSEANTRYPA